MSGADWDRTVSVLWQLVIATGVALLSYQLGVWLYQLAGPAVTRAVAGLTLAVLGYIGWREATNASPQAEEHGSLAIPPSNRVHCGDRDCGSCNEYENP